MSSFTRGSQALIPSIRAQHHIHHPLTKTQTTLFSTTRAYNAKPQPPTSDNHKINPPTSTLPAPINLPTSLPTSASTPEKLKNLINHGRAYITFYKTGLKNVWHNYRASLPHRKTLGLSTYIPTSPHKSPHSDKLHRGQYQLVHRSARDVRRMIPFTLVLVICGEFTPLIIPFFGTTITPATCRVPKQLTKERDALSESKWRALSAVAQLESAKDGSMPTATPALGSSDELGLLVQFADLNRAREADAAGVLRACAGLGLAKSVERAGAPLLVTLVYRRRLLGYLDYLRIDDRLIRTCGGVEALSGDEVRIALGERGAMDFAAVEQNEKELRVWLKKWLDARKE
ncbi:hypothetical protein N7495_009795 [Penicillium taxi]|uniref:uncharacterized protein n=1 Tax=Penicillium taxi TaxID=168475 RepID=UPI00254582DA|nr:uncharacterized protein N7495_009795 [Penicillium taxi]KAJ5885285.1 hypothetical protein N7495_009795 [Penicillium taxi]